MKSKKTNICPVGTITVKDCVCTGQCGCTDGDDYLLSTIKKEGVWNMNRKWYFTVNDEADCIDADGNIVDEEDEKSNPFIGTDKEAAMEADRRADLYEVEHMCLVNKIKYNSLGRVDETNKI